MKVTLDRKHLKVNSIASSPIILNTPTPPCVQHLVNSLSTFVQQRRKPHRCETVYPSFSPEPSPGPTSFWSPHPEWEAG